MPKTTVKISFIPFNPYYKNNLQFDGNQGRDRVHQPYSSLKTILGTHGYNIATNDINSIHEADVVLATKGWSIRDILSIIVNRKLKRTIYWATEPEVVYKYHSHFWLKLCSYFVRKVIVWDDDIVNNRNILKYHSPIPFPPKDSEVIDFNEKLFLTAIVGFKTSNHKEELYSHRIKDLLAIDKILPGSIDLYGQGWNYAECSIYKGEVKSKWDKLKLYKYTLCYENQQSRNGLISEKIFDCFYAQTVPIFWGAANVTAYIPSTCFIDRRSFKSIEELVDKLLRIEQHEYQEYLDNIKIFMKSKSFKMFLPDYFSQSILNAVKGIYNE